MTHAALTDGYDLAQLYAPARKPFRLKRSSAIALSAAVAFHAVVGFYVVKTKFEQPSLTYIDPGGITIDLPAPPPPRPPVQKDVPKSASAPKYHVASISDPAAPVLPILPALPDDGPAPAGPVATLDPTPAAPAAPAAPAPAPVIRNPSWLKKPTSEQVGRLYPTRAAERGITGGATLLCEVLASGDVSNCAVVDESPKSYRFGEAALAMSRYFRLNPRTVDGAAESGVRVRIPIVFNLN